MRNTKSAIASVSGFRAACENEVGRHLPPPLRTDMAGAKQLRKDVILICWHLSFLVAEGSRIDSSCSRLPISTEDALDCIAAVLYLDGRSVTAHGIRRFPNSALQI